MGILALSGLTLTFAGLAHLDYRPKSAVWSGAIPALVTIVFGLAALLGQSWADMFWLAGILAAVLGGAYNIKLTYKVRPRRR